MHTLARQAGITLIELMVTVAVLAVIATIAIPGFQSHIKDNRRVTEVNELVSALNLARSEATKSNSAVGFCPSSTGSGCTATNYEEGWIVFINNDADTPPAVDSGEVILRTHEGIGTPNTSLRGSTAIASGVNYTASGRPGTFGDITYCDDRGEAHARSVVINLVGTIAASDRHADGSDLSCP